MVSCILSQVDKGGNKHVQPPLTLHCVFQILARAAELLVHVLNDFEN